LAYSPTVLPSRNRLKYRLNLLRFCLFHHFYASFSYLNRLHLPHRINLVWIAFIRLNRHQDRHLLDHCPKFHFDLHPHRHKDHYNPP
jgi:hypothetical protein